MARGYIRKRCERSWQLVYDAPRGFDERFSRVLKFPPKWHWTTAAGSTSVAPGPVWKKPRTFRDGAVLASDPISSYG